MLPAAEEWGGFTESPLLSFFGDEMILVDIVVWAVLLAFMVKGFLKGLVREVCSLLGLLVGGWAAFHYYPWLAEAMTPVIRLPHALAQAFSFILIFFSLGILSYLVGHFVTGLLKLMLLGWLNGTGGVMLGFLEGGFILAVLLYLGSISALPPTPKAAIVNSRSAQPFIATGKEIVAGWDVTANFRPKSQPRR
jgi:membrane protein required for colicin V production